MIYHNFWTISIKSSFNDVEIENLIEFAYGFGSWEINSILLDYVIIKNLMNNSIKKINNMMFYTRTKFIPFISSCASSEHECSWAS